MSLRERELRTPCNVIKEAGIKDTGHGYSGRYTYMYYKARQLGNPSMMTFH